MGNCVGVRKREKSEENKDNPETIDRKQSDSDKAKFDQ